MTAFETLQLTMSRRRQRLIDVVHRYGFRSSMHKHSLLFNDPFTHLSASLSLSAEFLSCEPCINCLQSLCVCACYNKNMIMIAMLSILPLLFSICFTA